MASLRHALDEPTDEATALRARERRAQQIAALRRFGDGKPEEVASHRTLEPSHEVATDVDTPSLRARERAQAVR